MNRISVGLSLEVPADMSVRNLDLLLNDISELGKGLLEIHAEYDGCTLVVPSMAALMATSA